MLSEELLRSRYPLTYRESIVCGCWCPEEWEDIIFELSAKIEDHLKLGGLDSFRVDQIKEKFRGLRFYVSGSDATIDLWIGEAENKVIELNKVNQRGR